jgi:hypothetical protein
MPGKASVFGLLPMTGADFDGDLEDLGISLRRGTEGPDGRLVRKPPLP